LERQETYGILVVKPLGMPRRIWEDNIKIDLGDVVTMGGGWD
jgi:hypothetical protein